MVRERRWIGERERKIKYRVRKDINGMHGRKAEKRRQKGRQERARGNKRKDNKREAKISHSQGRERETETKKWKD